MSQAIRSMIARKSALLALGCLLAACRPALFSAPATAIVPLPALANLVAPISASAVAVDPTGEHIAAVNPDSGTISLINILSAGAPGAPREVSVGADPRTL